MNRPASAFTLVEVLAAALIVAAVGGGTLMAFVTASRIARQRNSASTSEGGFFAQQTLERFRNDVSVDANRLPGLSGAGWQSHPLPPAPVAGSNTESILNEGAKRCYQVYPADCDGVSGTGDCYGIQVKVCWNGTVCPCS